MLAARVCNSVHRAERLALIEWAAESNRILEPTFVEQFRHVSSGAEHAVFHDQCNALAIKATHPNRFGHSARGDGTPATPLEYLRRLGWHNLLFGDDVRILGVILDEGNIEIVTSQPWIVADPTHFTTLDEIDAYFAGLEFVRVELTPDVPLYFRRKPAVVIADAHQQNVLTTEDGHLVPIDVVVGVPSQQLLAQMEEELDRRRANPGNS